MPTLTTTDIQIATDIDFNTLSINETKPYCTTRTFIPDELPRGVDLYMRVRHHTDNASMDTPWSDTRQFQIESDAKIIGVCMDNSDTTKAPVWDWIDKDGNKVDTFDSTTYPVYANAEGVVVTLPSGRNPTTYMKIPKFYVKTMVSGPINTFAQGKKCWWISDRPVNGFRVHPAFYRKDDGTAADYVLIAVNGLGISYGYVSRRFDIYDFGLCVLLTYIQSKKNIFEIEHHNPSFPIDSDMNYIDWILNTIIAGTYYYSNSVSYSKGDKCFSIKNVMQLIDSPIPKIDYKKSFSIVEESGKEYVDLSNDINVITFKLESNNELSFYYNAGDLKSGSVSIDNITIDLMDLFIPDLSLPGSETNYFYESIDFVAGSSIYSDRDVFPSVVLMLYTSIDSGTIHFSPLWPSTLTNDGAFKYADCITGTDASFRMCLK